MTSSLANFPNKGKHNEMESTTEEKNGDNSDNSDNSSEKIMTKHVPDVNKQSFIFQLYPQNIPCIPKLEEVGVMCTLK